MHILKALQHKYRSNHQMKRYHSMVLTQIVRNLLGSKYDRLIYKNNCIWLIGCPPHYKLMIYIQKKNILEQIEEKLGDYQLIVAIKDIRFS